MITLIINTKVKLKRLEEYKELISQLTKESRKRLGCVSYVFNQRIDEATEFVLYEQWENQSSLDSHIEELLGPPRSGEILPAKLMDMYERAESKIYEAVE